MKEYSTSEYKIMMRISDLIEILTAEIIIKKKAMHSFFISHNKDKFNKRGDLIRLQIDYALSKNRSPVIRKVIKRAEQELVSDLHLSILSLIIFVIYKRYYLHCSCLYLCKR